MLKGRALARAGPGTSHGSAAGPSMDSLRSAPQGFKNSGIPEALRLVRVPRNRHYRPSKLGTGEAQAVEEQGIGQAADRGAKVLDCVGGEQGEGCRVGKDRLGEDRLPASGQGADAGGHVDRVPK